MDNKNELMKRAAVVFPITMLCCLLWGSAFPCIKIGYEALSVAADDSFTQLLFAGIRFFLAGILTIIIGSAGKRKLMLPDAGAMPKIMLLSLFQTILQYTFFYIGLARTTGMKSSIITASNVFLAIIISVFVFRQEKLTLRKTIGCILGFTGVVIVNLTSGADMGFRLSGEGLIFLSATSYSVSSSLTKRYSCTYDPVMLSGWQFIFGGAVMTAAGSIMGGHLDTVTAKGIIMLIYLAFVSAIAFSLWGVLLKYNPVSKIAVFGFMNPVFGAILSALLLSESGTPEPWRVVVSLILIAAGIITVNLQTKGQGSRE